MNIKDFAEKYIKAETEAFQKGNFEPLKAIEDPKVVYHMSSLVDRTSSFTDYVGHEAHKQQIMIARQAWSDIKQEWQYLVGEGNLCALSLIERIISRGNMPGMPPAGQEATSSLLFLLRVKGGKVVEAWNNGGWKGIDWETVLKAFKK